MHRIALALLIACPLVPAACAAPQPASGAADGFQAARDGVRRSLDDLKGDCAKPGADGKDCARTVPAAERLLAEAEAAHQAGQGGQALVRLRQAVQLVREGLARSRRRVLAAGQARAIQGRDEALAALRRGKAEVARLRETFRRCCEASPGKEGEKACERSQAEIDALSRSSDAMAAEGKSPRALEVLREAAALARRATAACERLRSAPTPAGTAR